RQRELPEEELAGALRQRIVKDLHVLAVGPVVADLDAGDEHFAVLAVVAVEGIGVGPGVVGLPGVVAALEDEVGQPIVADNEDDVALVAMLRRRQLAEVDTAHPVVGDLEGGAGLPLALAQALRADRRSGLGRAGKRSEPSHVPAALAL